MSASLQGSATPPTADEKVTAETTAIASENFDAPDLRIFQAAIVPTTPALVSRRFTGQVRSALVNVAVRNDEGLLAWLSLNSSGQHGGNSDFGDDHDDFLGDDADWYQDAADSALETLTQFTDSTPKLLASIG